MLVDNINQINVYSSSGHLIDSFGSGQIGHGGPLAVAGNGEPGRASSPSRTRRTTACICSARNLPASPSSAKSPSPESPPRECSLTASIDPTGLETEHAFRYSTETLPPATEACGGACHETPAAGIGSGFADVPVEPEVKDLAPGTQYHYEVIANNSAGQAASAEQTFKTAPEVFGATLPDSRQWQMVSPSNKNGALIPGARNQKRGRPGVPDGSAFTYASQGALPGAEGNRVPELAHFFPGGPKPNGSRPTSTCRTKKLKGSRPPATHYRWFTPDLSAAALQPFGEGKLERPPLNKAATEKTPPTSHTRRSPAWRRRCPKNASRRS